LARGAKLANWLTGQLAALRPIPPLLAIVYLGAAEGVNRLLPSEPLVPVGLASRIVGISCFVGGIALAIWAAVQFNRVDTTKDPYGTPTSLVTTGPFQYTRNPMYVGMTLSLLGLGLHFATAAYVAVPVAFC